MYTTVNGLTNEAAAEDIGGFADLSETRQDRFLRSANRTVTELAPPPDPRTEEYQEVARDAELSVIEFLLTTEGGVLKSSSLSDAGADTYVGFDAVREMVRVAMGGYYVGVNVSPVNTSAGTTVSNLSDEPLWST